EAAPPPQSHVTTTPRGHTAHSEADPRSAAFTTSVGRTARSCAGRALRACRARARWRAQSRGAQRPTAGADAPGSTPASAGSDEPASDATAPSPRAAGLAGPMMADDPKLSSGKLTAAPALTVGRGDRQRDRCRRVHVGWVVDGNSSHPCARETFLQEEDDANGFATSREYTPTTRRRRSKAGVSPRTPRGRVLGAVDGCDTDQSSLETLHRSELIDRRRRSPPAPPSAP